MNEAPSRVTIVHPLGSNMVSGGSVTRRLVELSVLGIVNGQLVGPQVVVYIPSNVAAIRQETMIRSTMSTNTQAICLVRRPITTLVNTNTSVLGPCKRVMIS